MARRTGVCMIVQAGQVPVGEDGTLKIMAWAGLSAITLGVALGAGEEVSQEFYDRLGLDREQVEEQFDELVNSKDSVMAMAGMMSQ